MIKTNRACTYFISLVLLFLACGKKESPTSPSDRDQIEISQQQDDPSQISIPFKIKIENPDLLPVPIRNIYDSIESQGRVQYDQIPLAILAAEKDFFLKREEKFPNRELFITRFEEEYNNLILFLQEVKDKHSANPALGNDFKALYRAGIARSAFALKSGPQYHQLATSIIDLLTSFKVHSYSGTLLHDLLMRNLLSAQEYKDARPITLIYPSFIAPGRLLTSPEKIDYALFSDTVSNNSLTHVESDLTFPRIIDANYFALAMIFRPYTKNREHLSEIIKISRENLTFGAPSEELAKEINHSLTPMALPQLGFTKIDGDTTDLQNILEIKYNRKLLAMAKVPFRSHFQKSLEGYWINMGNQKEGLNFIKIEPLGQYEIKVDEYLYQQGDSFPEKKPSHSKTIPFDNENASFQWERIGQKFNLITIDQFTILYGNSHRDFYIKVPVNILNEYLKTTSPSQSDLSLLQSLKTAQYKTGQTLEDVTRDEGPVAPSGLERIPIIEEEIFEAEEYQKIENYQNIQSPVGVTVIEKGDEFSQLAGRIFRIELSKPYDIEFSLQNGFLHAKLLTFEKEQSYPVKFDHDKKVLVLAYKGGDYTIEITLSSINSLEYQRYNTESRVQMKGKSYKALAL